MIRKVIKRDGRVERFDKHKIENAIRKAFFSCGLEMPNHIIDKVIESLIGFRVLTVEKIQDVVERVLMEEGYFNVAKAYIVYRHMCKQIRDEKKLLGIKDDLKLSLNALKILADRYLQNETPSQMFWRVAKIVARVEKRYGGSVRAMENVFYEMMSKLVFLPNSPALRNAGKSNQLAACFVLPIEDSLKDIFETVKNTALIHQTGGGVGFSFGKLRPRGDIVRSTGGRASGPVSFMRIFDIVAEEITSGGMRSGANMAILPVNHPDIVEFISCKEDERKLRNFNISVAVDDTFIDAVKKNKSYWLVNPRTKKSVRKVNAREIFDLMCAMAWRNGEPGIVFIDNVNRKNVLKEKIEATNPCSEQPLLPYESCVLGSINLSKFVTSDIDWALLSTTVYNSVQFLDNMIDACTYPTKQIEKKTKQTRKIGIGVMGFADVLVELEIPYVSKEAERFAQKLMGFINREARKKSEELGEQRGNFLLFEESKLRKRYKHMRNATVTTIAPTGTLSIIANCNSGIEPFFALAYRRYSIFSYGSPKEELVVLNPLLKKRVELNEKDLELVLRTGSVQGTKLPKKVKRIFMVAHDILPEWHVRIQAAFQKYTDNAVSKTVNLPFEASVNDVRKVFLLAHKLGCKGITVYRNKSRSFQVLNIDVEFPTCSRSCERCER